jgi:hypothetical protein
MDSTALRFRQSLIDRFGLPQEVLDGYVFIQKSPKRLAFHPISHVVPDGLPIETCGQYLAKLSFQFPKLATGAARVLGRYARKNCVHLGRDQFRTYLKREDLWLDDTLAQSVDGDGYVLVFYAGAACGVGLVHLSTEGCRLRSLFPKDWAQQIEHESHTEGELQPS